MNPQDATNGLVVNSDFSYTPPPGAAPEEHAEFSQLLKDSIKEIEGEYNPPPEVDETQEAPEAEPEVTPEAEPEAQADDPAVARGMDRLIQREVALQAKESAFQAREGKVASLEQELATLRTKIPAADVQDKLAYSPSEVIKALGHDPKMIVRLMLAEQMAADGQEIPPALKEFVQHAEGQRKTKAVEAEVAQLKAQLADKQRLDQATAYFNTVALGARAYVEKQVDAKTLPTLAGIAKVNPDRVHREIMEEITNDARGRASADPNGEPLTYPEAAKRVEARLADYVALVQTRPGTTQAPTGAGRPTLRPTTQPPAKPLKPWETPATDIYKQGIAEAEREFLKVEAANRARK